MATPGPRQLPGLKPHEQRANRALAPAFATGTELLRQGVREAAASLQPGRAGLDSLPWDSYAATLAGAWLPVSLRAARGAGRAAMRVKGTTKITQQVADAIATGWASRNANATSRGIANTTRAGMERVIANAQARGWTDRRTAQALEDWAGATPSDVDALMRQADLLETAGTDDRLARATLRSRANDMVIRRRRGIARTEANAARNGAARGVWERMRDEGQIMPDSLVEWVTNDPCPVCEGIAAQGPQPIGEGFPDPTTGGTVLSPPRHPNCRCELRLLPAAFPED